jgi:hypothetical protein
MQFDSTSSIFMEFIATARHDALARRALAQMMSSSLRKVLVIDATCLQNIRHVDFLGF